MKRIRALLGTGLLLCVAMGVSIGLAEVAVRMIAPRSTSIASQDRYGLAMHYPGITRYLPDHGQTVAINSVGMRDREHSLEKAEDAHRVIVLGDSFMEAVQVAADESLPRLLEDDLTRELGRPTDVINAGVSGWGTDDELRYLTEYGLEYDPDLVVLTMTLHNDVSDNLRQEWHTVVDGELVDQNVEPISWFTYKKLQVKAFLAVRLQLVQLVRLVRNSGAIQTTTLQLRSHVAQLFDDPPPEQISTGWELTELVLEEMKAVTTEKNARLVVVLLPLEYQLSDETFDAWASNAGLDLETVDRHRPQRMMTDIAARLDIPVIDLEPAFRQWTADGGETLYVSGDGHWNERGHRLATDVVVRELIAMDTVASDGVPH